MVTVHYSHTDLAKAYLTDGRKTGVANVLELGLHSNNRPVHWIRLGKNGLIEFSGKVGSKGTPWKQTYRNKAPLND